MTRSRLVRAGLGITALLLAALALPAPASAHDELDSTFPRDGSHLAAPRQVVLTFAEPVLALGNRIEVVGPSGQVVSGAPTIQGSTLRAPLQPGLPAGAYRVTWRAVSADGHPVSGSFGFTVTAASAGASATPLTTQAPAATASGATATPGAGATGTPARSERLLAPLALGLLALGALAAAGAVAMARRRAGQGRG